MKRFLVSILLVSNVVYARDTIDLVISGKGTSPDQITSIPYTNQITIGASEYIWVDFVVNSNIGLYALDQYIDIQGPASLSFESIYYPEGMWDLAWPGSGADFDEGGPYVYVTAGLTYTGISDYNCINELAVGHILIHAEGEGTTTVNPILTENHGGTIDFLFDSYNQGTGVTITQIPEPGSLLLLGAGVVLLRRKRL